MQLFFILAALLSAVVFALPAPAEFGLTPRAESAESSSYGVTLYKQQYLRVNSMNSDKIGVGFGYCTDLNNLFGGWAGQVRSLEVKKGAKCSFYTTHQCQGGKHFDAGFQDRTDARRRLGNDFDGKILSVICRRA